MSSAVPLLDQTIEPDEPSQTLPVPSGRIGGASSPTGRAREQVILTPTASAPRVNPNATPGDTEEGEPVNRLVSYLLSPSRHLKGYSFRRPYRPCRNI